MNNAEKLATLGIQDTRQKQNKKHNTICVGHTLAAIM